MISVYIPLMYGNMTNKQINKQTTNTYNTTQVPFLQLLIKDAGYHGGDSIHLPPVATIENVNFFYRSAAAMMTTSDNNNYMNWN